MQGDCWDIWVVWHGDFYSVSSYTARGRRELLTDGHCELLFQNVEVYAQVDEIIEEVTDMCRVLTLLIKKAKI